MRSNFDGSQQITLLNTDVISCPCKNHFYTTIHAPLLASCQVHVYIIEADHAHACIIDICIYVSDALSVDWISNKLYWAQACTVIDFIGVLDLTTNQYKRLIEDTRRFPYNLLVDPTTRFNQYINYTELCHILHIYHALRWLYWTDISGDRTFTAEIIKASMDGRGRTVLVSTLYSSQSTLDMSLDYQNQVLYWINYISRIESINTDGTNRRVISQQLTQGIYGLSLHEDTLFLSRGTDVYKLSTSGHNETILFHTCFGSTLKTMHERRQPQGMIGNISTVLSERCAI